MIFELISEHSWFIYLYIGVFSLCVGSLLNVIIHRLPIMLQSEWQQQCCTLLEIEKPKDEQPPINLFVPRSFCPQCNSTIKFWQNIPVLSYLLLKGRCYSCKNSIAYKYPLIELGTMILSLLACAHFGLTLPLIFALLALWLLIPLFFIDLEHQLLPDGLTLSLLWLGLIANTSSLFTSLPNAVLSAAAAYLSLWLFIKLFYLITGKIGMGHGDFKLFAAFGAWFGWQSLPFILLCSSLLGTIVGVIYLSLKKKDKDTPIPFGPFLCTSAIIYLFIGTQLIQSYLNFFFL